MNDDLKVLKHFLQMPLGSADPVFKRFLEVPGSIFRGQSPERFLYIRGYRKNRVLLVAHADTAWDRNISAVDLLHDVYFEKGMACSGAEGVGIGADDRAGCCIVWLLKELGHSVLITDGEETGLKGSSWLMESPENSDIAQEINDDHRFVVQFDRCNGTDFKCYKVGTPEFKEYVKKQTNFIDAGETRSTDISMLCKSITGVNLSIGYYNEHQGSEFLNLAQWRHTLNLCKKWLAKPELPRFSRITF